MSSTLPVRILRRSALSPEVTSFDLGSLGGDPLPLASPGSHVDVHLRPGLVRQYSLCGGPQDAACYRIAVKRERHSRGGSVAMHALSEGDVLHISPPRNNFRLDLGHGPCVLVAGGIGITPLISMAYHMRSTGREFALLYFARTPEDAAFHDEIEQSSLAERTTYFFTPDPGEVESALRKRLTDRSDGAQMYLCGPKPFMDLAVRIAANVWPQESIHLEHFGRVANEDTPDGKAFRLVLDKSGVEVDVSPQETIVQALTRIGITVPVSCEQGICGTCLTRCLSGDPDHRDSYLTEREKLSGTVLCPCVSRSLSPSLVLDL